MKIHRIVFILSAAIILAGLIFTSNPPKAQASCGSLYCTPTAPRKQKIATPRPPTPRPPTRTPTPTATPVPKYAVPLLAPAATSQISIPPEDISWGEPILFLTGAGLLIFGIILGLMLSRAQSNKAGSHGFDSDDHPAAPESSKLPTDDNSFDLSSLPNVIINDKYTPRDGGGATDWGDQLFKTGTVESVNEATTHYTLADAHEASKQFVKADNESGPLEQVAGDKPVNITSDPTEKVGANKTTTITSDQFEGVGGDKPTTIGSDPSEKVGGDQLHKVNDGSATLKGSERLTDKAQDAADQYVKSDDATSHFDKRRKRPT
jgi:hypothetical protein